MTDNTPRGQGKDFHALTAPLPIDGEALRKNPLPELLLPAGSPAALSAAIEAGADAVYFGASAFSARARAVNFTDEEACDALALCHAYGVKAYAAVNTRIRDAELSRATELCRELYRGGVDGIILADMGLCALLREMFPDLELHASTQLTPTFLSDAHALYKAGFSRMVAPRELSLGEIQKLTAESPIEIEAFVHGAHCVSLSGQCLMSSMIGGRSANRGECAQPCRMKYRLGGREGYLLSLADMCYGGNIPALIASGVRSLKIEGRQKDENYVYGVGRIYRRLLDERRGAAAEEISRMAQLFERGFTDGYLRRSYKNMTGVRLPDAKSDKPFERLTKKVGIGARLELFSGKRARLTLYSPAGEAFSQSEEVCAPSQGEPLSEDRARAGVAKLGQTPFELKELTFEGDGTVWLSASELNALRREAAQRLLALSRRDTDAREVSLEEAFVPPFEETVRIGEFVSEEQIPPEAEEFFHRIYLPYTEFFASDKRSARGLSLPPYMTDGCAAFLRERIAPGDRVLAHTVGQLEFARSLGANADASFRLNVMNLPCAREIFSRAGEDGVVTLSPELNAGQMRDISRKLGASGAVVYGRIPIMHTVRCMMSPGGCKNGGFGGYTPKIRKTAPCRGEFTDRCGARFPVIGERDCTNTLYNSAVLWMADKPSALSPFSAQVFIFSDEDKGRVSRVICAYRGEKMSPPSVIRRIK